MTENGLANSVSNVVDRLTEYLSRGGLFNPELMDHGSVQELLYHCRETLLTYSELSPDHLAARDAEVTRRALEMAAKALVNSKILVEEYSPYTSGKRCGADDQIQSGHDAILALQPAPTEWVMVPVELPAENNKKAVKLALSTTLLSWPDYMNSLYRAMIGSKP